MMRKIIIGFISFATAFTLSACNSSKKEISTEEESNVNVNTEENVDMPHSDMNHTNTGEVPKGLGEAKNPTFEVGSKVILKTGHMEGMQGAEATVVGAYDTTAYVISYTPTHGGEKVDNHKWVIQEEIKDAGEKVLAPGTKVTIEADHMTGMKGATGEIDRAEQTTVYMIDYTPTTGGEVVKNHKWVTESELTPK
nr:YdhK family protein [Bacillus sp. FJAT-22090]